ncbi:MULTISPECIES: hypothetical protein [Paraburkholderia]|uniref:hypothetical protein n=1 Tax=Paraburkholderia TaxID=1822464 RepID=UPI0038B94BBA
MESKVSKSDGELDQYNEEFTSYLNRSVEAKSNVHISFGVRLFSIAVCGWTIIETPAEYDAFAGLGRFLALLISKVIWLVLGVALLRKIRGAQQAFSILCFISIFAIFPALPFEFDHSIFSFCLSLTDCILKIGFLASIVLRYLDIEW